MKKNCILFFLLCFVFSFAQNKIERDTLLLTAVGDIMMGTNFPEDSYLPSKEIDPFTKTNAALTESDILFGNLEGALADTAENEKKCKDIKKCYSFRTPTKFAKYLKNFDILSLANNHIFDFGVDGMNETTKALEQYHIKFAGPFQHPYSIFTKDSITYGFCAFAPNKGCLNIVLLNKAKKIVQQLNAKCDIVIVSFHGGAEGREANHVTRETETFYGENRGNPYLFAHTLIDAGADVVLGHGPHVPRAIEVYKDRFIAYSLGNFCTYKRFNLSNNRAFAPIIRIKYLKNGKFIEGKIISAKQIDGKYPLMDVKKGAFYEIKKLTQEDFPEVPIQFFSDTTFRLIE